MSVLKWGGAGLAALAMLTLLAVLGGQLGLWRGQAPEVDGRVVVIGG